MFTIYSGKLPASGFKQLDASYYEKYLNNPADTTQEELPTEIHVPIE